MKINQDLLAGVREAMSLLQRDGPVSATAKIQQTLRGLTPAVHPGEQSGDTPAGSPGAARRERNITPVQPAPNRAAPAARALQMPAPLSAPLSGQSPADQASSNGSAVGSAAAVGPRPGVVASRPAPAAAVADREPAAIQDDGEPATSGHRRIIPDLLARLGVGSKLAGAQTGEPGRDASSARRSGAKHAGADRLGADRVGADRLGAETLGPGAFLAGSYSNHAGSRDYRLYVPTTHRQSPPTAGTALVVLLHGCSQTPVDFAAGTRFNLLAEGPVEGLACLVLYPAQTRKANLTRCWNWFRPTDQQRGDGEPALIAGMTREVVERYGIDPARVFIAGLSAGGAMALTMANTYPELYAAVGVHSGIPHAAASDIGSALAAMQGGGDPIAGGPNTGGGTAARPLILFHGDRDQTVHPDNATHIVARARPAPGTIETHRDQVDGGHAYTRTRHRDASGRLMIEHWTLHGAGHAWSGGSSRGTYTDGRGPDASQAMLRFFSAVAGDGEAGSTG